MVDFTPTMTSYNQTALLWLATAPFPVDTYCRRPLMPIAAQKKFSEGYSVKLTRYDGTIIIWYVSGEVVETLTNGNTTVFMPKPTIADAIKSQSTAQYTYFHKGGSVSWSDGIKTMHWSVNTPAFAENGEIFFDHICGEQKVWDDECKGHCGYESQCDDDRQSCGPCHSCGAKDGAEIFERFCSRDCMKYYIGDD